MIYSCPEEKPWSHRELFTMTSYRGRMRGCIPTSFRKCGSPTNFPHIQNTRAKLQAKWTVIILQKKYSALSPNSLRGPGSGSVPRSPSRHPPTVSGSARLLCDVYTLCLNKKFTLIIFVITFPTVNQFK